MSAANLWQVWQYGMLLCALAGNGWLERVLKGGDKDDTAALAAAAELSVRSNHPVSKAVAAVRSRAGGNLPKVDIIDFKLVPGALIMKDPLVLKAFQGLFPVQQCWRVALDTLPYAWAAANEACCISRPCHATDDTCSLFQIFQPLCSDRRVCSCRRGRAGHHPGKRQQRQALCTLWFCQICSSGPP